MNTKVKNHYQHLVFLFSAIICLFFCGFVSFGTKKQVEAADISYTITDASKNDSYFCIRDYDLIMTENQDSFGMCWDFSTTSALESFLARTTGMVYDFSEAWIALCNYIDDSSNVIGSGGSFSGYYDLMKKYGVLLESQFPQEMIYQIDTKNAQEIYDYYSQFANKNLFNNITKVQFTNSTDNSASNSSYILSVKEHLINYGALTFSYDDDYRFNQSGVNDSVKTNNRFIHRNMTDVDVTTFYDGSWHQIIITGWDDNISFTDKYGATQTGAFICTNSWGVEERETLYVSYNDLCVNGKGKVSILGHTQTINYPAIYGFSSLTQSDFSARITSTTSNMKNLDVKAYDLNTSNDTTGYYKQSNIFYAGENVSISYRYYTSTSYKVSTRVEKNGQYFNNFDTFELNKTAQTLSVSKNNISSGEYIIWFEVDKNNDGVVDIYYPVTIMVYSGADLSDVLVYDEKYGTSYYIGDNTVKANFNTILSTEQDNIIYGFTTADKACYQFEFGTLSNVQSVSFLPLSNISSIQENYTIATDSEHTKGELVVYVNCSSSYSKNEAKITLTTTQNKTINIKIITYRIDDTSDNDKKVYVFYNLNGGYNNSANDRFIALGENYNKYSLKQATKKGYQFAGWYLDKNFTYNATSLDSADLVKGNLDNYADTSSTNKYFIILYAKWEDYQDVVYQDKTISTYHYGDQLDFDFDLAEYGSNDYTYDILSSLPTGISRSGYMLVGQIKSLNDIVVQIKVTDNETGQYQTATFTFKIQKREITYKVHNKQSKFGEALKELTGEIVSGNVIDGDNLGINLSLPIYVTRFSPVRDYAISASFSNNNYKVTFVNEIGEQENAIYSIRRTQFEFSFENIVLTYDGNNHHIDTSVIDSSDYENLLIEYSTDNISYSEEAIEVKDFTNGAKVIYIRVSADNYDTQNFTPTITINQKQLTITIVQDQFVYEKNVAHHTEVSVDMSQVIESDRDSFEIIFADSKVNVGSYSTDISCSNDNYLLSITNVEYEITKATPSQKNENIPIVSDEIPLAEKWSDLSLPTGYSWKYPNKQIDYGDNFNIAVFVPEDTQNYTSFEKEVYFSKPEPLNTDLITIIAIAVVVVFVLVFIISSIVRSTRDRAPREKKVKTNNKNKPSYAEVTIRFVTNSPIVLPPMYGNRRQVMQLPNLNRNFYEFGGWFTDRLFLHPYENNGIERELTLYARWKPKL